MELYLDARLGESLGGAGDERGLVLDYITDVIRCGSGGEGDVFTCLQDGHLQIGVDTFGFCCGAGASGTASDHYEFL
jgi:hypothetical protein